MGASLLRLWGPPPDTTDEGCHLSVADFGAGGGHYCRFLTRTGEVCCHAFDGTPRAALLSGGKVQTARLDDTFDLGRKFDWVICLEVAEHIPRESEDVMLGNLKRHSARG